METWTLIEWIAVLLGFGCVWLNAAENIWGWPLGILNVCLYLMIFFRAKLYADVSLQVFFLGACIYGWYQWLHGGANRTELSITRSSWQEWLSYLGIGTAGLLLIGFFFDRYTDADLAYWDAYTTSFSLVAQVLLARKKLENWLIWIAVDVIAIGIYYYKGLYPTAFLYVGYLLIATGGYFNWRRRGIGRGVWE
jgi:nicotinamide mononucleotide transporter